jgi:hypothetical protein
VKPKPTKLETYGLDKHSGKQEEFLREAFKTAGRADGSIDTSKLTALDRVRLRQATGDGFPVQSEALSIAPRKIKAEMPMGLSVSQQELLREVFSEYLDSDGCVDFARLYEDHPLAATRASRLLGRSPSLAMAAPAASAAGSDSGLDDVLPLSMREDDREAMKKALRPHMSGGRLALSKVGTEDRSAVRAIMRKYPAWNVALGFERIGSDAEFLVLIRALEEEAGRSEIDLSGYSKTARERIERALKAEGSPVPALSRTRSSIALSGKKWSREKKRLRDGDSASRPLN